MKLTDTHIAILERGADGRTENWEARYLLDGRNVTRQVNTLKRQGLVSVTGYAGGRLAAWATDAGRAALREAETNCDRPGASAGVRVTD